MFATLKQVNNTLDHPEIQEIAQKLAEHGLGICLPHMHDGSGKMTELPSELVSIEKDLQVSFYEAKNLPETRPVAWRWNNKSNSLEVCAGCNVGRVCH